MGAAYVEHRVSVEDPEYSFKTLRETEFQEYLSDNDMTLSDYDGYSGTLYEKQGLIVHKTPCDLLDAQELLMQNDKWDPAEAYRLNDGSWLIGGWCSS
jgi:hypothetical protein